VTVPDLKTALAAADDLDPDALWSDLVELSRETRLSGSPEEARAFDHAERTLRELGFDVRRDEHQALVGLPVSASLEVLEPERVVFECNVYSFSPSTPTDGVVAELIDGDVSNGAGSGKILLRAGLGTPTKSMQANASGVLGQIHVGDEHLHEMCVSPVWGAPVPETLSLLPAVPEVGVTAEVGARLRALLAQGPVTVRLRAETTLDWRPIPLLTADLPGTEEDMFVLFSAHIDSWYAGAMDNATGNAVQLAVARVLAARRHELRRGIRIAFWSGHSHGRYAGSAHYADAHWQELHDRCVCHVNIDSVGPIGAVIHSDASTMAETHGFASELIETFVDQALNYRRIGRSADQSFWGIGIPSLFSTFVEQAPSEEGSASMELTRSISGAGISGGGFGWWLHTTEDTLDKVDRDFLVRDGRVFVAALSALCSRAVVPLDYAAAAAEIRDRLGEYAAACGDIVDLTPAIDAAERLRGVLEALPRLASERPEAAAAVNRALLELGHHLVPINYTVGDRFDHDLALNFPPVPALADAARLAGLEPGSTEQRALATKLVRERNRIRASLEAAARVARDVLEAA
jgi:hypothetical protein